MVVALSFAYLLPIITFSICCFWSRILCSNIKSELANIKLKKFNLITLSTAKLAMFINLRFYIYLFPNSLNSRLRPLAFPLMDLLFYMFLLFVFICFVQFAINLKECGLKKLFVSMFFGGCLGLTSAPIFFLILKGLKKIIPDDVLLHIVDVLEFIVN